jgi:hypothetical protein
MLSVGTGSDTGIGYAGYPLLLNRYCFNVYSRTVVTAGSGLAIQQVRSDQVELSTCKT